MTSWRACALAARELFTRTPMNEPMRSEAVAIMAAVDALCAGEQPVQAGAQASFISYGRNDHGCLGQGFLRTPTWEPARDVELPQGAHVVQVGAGDSCCCFVTSDGALLLSGSNRGYVHADRQAQGRAKPTPVQVLAGRKVTRAFMASGSAHILAFVDGRLHAWGGNSKPLGLNKTSPTLAPMPVENLAGTRYEGGIPEAEVSNITMSIGHTLIVMHSGEVFMSGSNARGQLGFGAMRNPYDTTTFERPAINGVSFQGGACGVQHSALIGSDGSLYVCGQNESGQLGLPDSGDRFAPAKVEVGSTAGRRIVDVACGLASTLCVSDDGALHGSGANGRGEIGLGELPGSTTFTAVPLPDGLKAKRVSAGDQHALVLCEGGAVLGFGDNSDAEVTPGNRGGFVKVPVRLEAFADRDVVAVIAGKQHSLVVAAG